MKKFKSIIAVILLTLVSLNITSCSTKPSNIDELMGIDTR